MKIYQQMYFKLFNKMTDMIFEIQEIQQEMEELFISSTTEEFCEDNEDISKNT